MKKISINLRYDPARELYVLATDQVSFSEGDIEIVLQLELQPENLKTTAGIASTAARTPGISQSGYSAISAGDSEEVFGPAVACAGTMVWSEADEDYKWVAGEPLFIGTPAFKVDRAEINGFLPFGLWGREWEVELQYVMIEEGGLKTICESAIRACSKITRWSVSIVTSTRYAK